MTRHCCWTLLAILLCVSLASADLFIPRPHARAEEISSFGLRSYVDTFVGHKRAVAIASGNYRSRLGLYVFDAFGNCVAHDDRSDPQTADDLAADWIPSETARYDVQVRSAGTDVNIYKISLR